MNTKNNFNIINYLKQFKAKSTFFWLQTILVHPNNQLYNQRLEYLLGLFLSIPQNQFGNKIPSQSDIQSLFDKSDEELSEIFLMYEDFEGFDQSKLIPLFIEGRSYYIFYGSLERPIEYYKKLADLYFVETNDEDLTNFRHCFLDSLMFQTHLLETIIELEESQIRQDSIYVPSEEFYNKIVPLFENYNFSYFDFEPMTIGVFQNQTEKSILSEVINNRLYQSPYILIDDVAYYAIPHIHYIILCNRGNHLLKKKNIKELVWKDFKNRTFLTCAKFFHTHKNIPALFLNFENDNLFENRIDFAVWLDNKLCLFRCIPHSSNTNIEKELNQTIKRLIRIKRLIKEQDVVGFIDLKENAPMAFYPKDIEIWLFPIFEATTLDVMAATDEGANEQLFLFSLMDLSAIFRELKPSLEFLKFLKEDKILSNRVSNPFMGEFMERFTYYLENGKSFFRSARDLNFMMFVPHMWADYSMEKLYKKHQDEAFAIMEAKNPNYFNRQEKYKENVYRALETAELSGVYLVRLRDRNIFIYTPNNGFNLKERYLQVGSEILTTLFADYIDKLRQPFSELLNANIRHAEYLIFLIPDYRVSKTAFSKIHSTDVVLSNENPISIHTNYTNSRKVITSIVYDIEHTTMLFSQNDNQGERYCIKKLVESILNLNYDEHISATNAEMFINMYLPIGQHRYSSRAIKVDNPKIEKYYEPIEINETEVAIVNREMSKFFIKNNYEPKAYEGKDAITLNYKVYCHLQDWLERKIQDFNEDFLKFAYKQLELIKGQRLIKKITFGMQASHEIDYDIVEAVQENYQKISQLSVVVKHIVHTTLKVGTKGGKYITKDSWTELLAIGAVLMETIMIYEYIEHDIKKHTLIIDNHYVLEDEVGDVIIEDLQYSLDKATINLDYSKIAYEKAIAPPKVFNKEKDDSFSEEMKALDDEFLKLYDFKYIDLLTVLITIRMSMLPSQNHSPIAIVSANEVFEHLQVFNGLPSFEVFEKILDFLSLRYGIYKPKDLLAPSNMMRNKERINICPFIKLDNGKYLIGNEITYNASKFWRNVSYGEFPFSLKKGSSLEKVVKAYHKKQDDELELMSEEIARKSIGNEYVEARILNFKRISSNFPKRPPCGEIDLLCINPNTKMIFVLDAKNINKQNSLYQLKNNIKDFFEGKKAYVKKLFKKRDFVKANLNEFGQYFKVNLDETWTIKQGFVVNELHFAAYYKTMKVDFIQLEDLSKYLTS